MAIKLNVFCVIVEHRVSSDMDSSLAIRVNRHWQRRRNRQIEKDKKLIFFIDVYGKCPNLTCHNLTSEEAFEQIGKGTESESGKQTELLILLQILDSKEGKATTNKDLLLIHQKIEASSLNGPATYNC
uniref:Uncharacterized protein n=1 Tax=Solanum lycopersicum TaxID=4081 RepID=A0A3Q7HN15_SOLLC